MGSLKDPKTWIPHIKPRDCSEKVCNIYCAKWCKYIIISSPPPPPPPLVKDDLGGTAISPVVIVIVALIGTLLLLIGYYFIFSRYCSRNNGSSSLPRRDVENQETHDHEVGVDGHDHDHHEDDHSNYVPWLVLGKGLNEALIKSITMFKYQRGDGLVTCTVCSVCLGEFQENESLRLLPKCSHAFHVSCIDTWFKTHSNCPLCRANVCFEVQDSPIISPSPPPPPTPPPPITCVSLGRDVTFEIRDEYQRKITRSKSLDHYLFQTRVPIAQVFLFDQTKEIALQKVLAKSDVGSSKDIVEGNNKGLSSVNVSYLGMKRSHSSGRYMLTREDG